MEGFTPSSVGYLWITQNHYKLLAYHFLTLSNYSSGVLMPKGVLQSSDIRQSLEGGLFFSIFSQIFLEQKLS